MITTFNLPADQLDLSILKSIKEAYRGRNIEIIINDTDNTNKVEVLLKRIKSIREDTNVHSFAQEDFFKTYRKKIANASNKI